MSIKSVISKFFARSAGYNPVTAFGGIKPDKPSGMTILKLNNRAKYQSSKILQDIARRKREGKLP